MCMKVDQKCSRGATLEPSSPPPPPRHGRRVHATLQMAPTLSYRKMRQLEADMQSQTKTGSPEEAMAVAEAWAKEARHTPLDAAAQRDPEGDAEKVRELLEEGAPVDGHRFNGEFHNPLDVAAMGRELECMRILIEKRAQLGHPRTSVLPRR